ncbi:MAG: hypothetical protein IT158_04600 [Bryobacterales bacterium]|nr:hypothetical protein [Bryobacterales bacterium]
MCEDTDPRVLEVWTGLQRRMTPVQKLRAMFEATEFLIRMQEAGVRRMYPDAGEREVFLRTAARRLPRELMIRVYGWDPEQYE